MSSHADPPDLCDLAKASKLLWKAQEELAGMVDSVAAARVIKENHSERSKQSLARAMKRAGDVSVSKAELLARCDEQYVQEIHQLGNQLEEAEKTLVKMLVVQSRLDGLRTLISAQKAVMNI